jgi:predicted lipid-binding transport protein (Tim44 family)
MKKILVAVAVAALTLGTLSTADARIGSSSSSSSSRSSSYTSSSSSGSRIGGSLGVSRPVAMAAATSQSQSARSYGNINANSTAARTVTSTTSTTTTSRNNGYYGSGSGYYGGAPAYGRPGYGAPGYTGGQLAAAAVGGAVVGAVADHALSNHGTTIINNGVGGGAPVYGNGDTMYSNGAVAVPVAAPATVYVSHQNGLLTFLEVILGIVVLFAVVAFLIRLFNSSTADAIYDAPADFRSSTTTTRRTTTTTTADPEEERAINKAKQLLAGGAQFYRSLQDANNRGDKARLSQMLTNDIYPAIAAEIDNRDGAAANTVVRELRIVGDEVLAFRSEGDTFFGSLHFKGKVCENGGADEDFDEVHHFKSEGINGPWKLEGIQPFGG